MDQLIELALKMPPIGSAVVSVVTLVIIWFGASMILANLAEQSKELKAQSKDLVDIKIQTTRTNGKVTALEHSFETHENLDEGRHVDTTKALEHNRNGIHDIRNSLSKIGIDAKLKERAVHEQEEAP